MSETVNVHLTTRGEYDVFSDDRVRFQKLARGVIYVLMLEIEHDDRRAGRVTAEIAKLPVVPIAAPEAAAPMEVLIMDEDAQPVFQMGAFFYMDQVYLEPTCLKFVNGGEILRQGYFLVNEENTDMAAELHAFVGSGSDVGGLSL